MVAFGAGDEHNVSPREEMLKQFTGKFGNAAIAQRPRIATRSDKLRENLAVVLSFFAAVSFFCSILPSITRYACIIIIHHVSIL